MKVLVTGSSGHLGEALVRMLQNRGYEVVGLDRLASRFTTNVGSIANRSHVKRSRVGLEDVANAHLLAEARQFIEHARVCPGVRRIALIGSLTTEKPDPKDADVLVSVDDDIDLAQLTAVGRRLKGRAQSRNNGADIFLADPSGDYIGRICHWRKCYPESESAHRATRAIAAAPFLARRSRFASQFAQPLCEMAT